MSSPGPVAANGTAANRHRSIGSYRIVAEKGAGRFGAVYLAEDTRTGRPVAVRLLPRAFADAPTVAETLRRRARTVMEASQTHPALIGVLEYGSTDDGQLFAVMERAEGGRFGDVLAGHRPLDVPAILQRAIEIGGPLETLHNQGLVHAAVRPDNFVIAEDDSVRLLDVELVAIRDVPALQPLVVESSPAVYLAPEQIEGQPASEKSDVYAFGVLLYQMLGGVPPFEGERREEAFDKHRQDTPPPLSQQGLVVPASVEAALVEALDKVPERRPFMQKILNQIATNPTSRSTSPGRWKRVAVPMAGLVATVFVGAPVVWSLLARPVTLRPPVLRTPVSAPIVPVQAPATSILPLPPAAEVSLPATLELPARPPTTATRVPSTWPSIPPPAARPAPARPADDNPPVTPWRPIAPPPSAPPVVRAPAPPEPRVERDVPRVVPPPLTAPASVPASAIPVATRDHDDGDPRAIIDWLLNKRGGGGEPDAAR
jgi:serine/threonine protein kinase